jgi:hypothetical protein
MPKYLIAYRKTDDTGQKPEWAVFTTSIELSLESHAVKERVVKRMSVLGEKLWGNGEAVWIGPGRLDDVLYRRDEAMPETSIVYGLVEE